LVAWCPQVQEKTETVTRSAAPVTASDWTAHQSGWQWACSTPSSTPLSCKRQLAARRRSAGPRQPIRCHLLATHFGRCPPLGQRRLSRTHTYRVRNMCVRLSGFENLQRVYVNMSTPPFSPSLPCRWCTTSSSLPPPSGS